MRKYQISNIQYPISKGFTLIELLTVIAIIGILTAFLTVSFIGVRQRGRDAQRKSNLKQIQSALELYRADNDSYPTTLFFNGISCGSPFFSGAVTYMSRMPCDPYATTTPYFYYQITPTSYVMASCLENTNDKDGYASGSAPSFWPTAFTAWPPGTLTATCSSAYYYATNNP